MTHIITLIVAKRLENGWEVSVSYKKPQEDITKTREFLISDISMLQSYLTSIEENQSLP